VQRWILARLRHRQFFSLLELNVISTCAEGFESKCQIVNGIGTDSGRNDREPVFGNP
jgi:hypothetical protein